MFSECKNDRHYYRQLLAGSGAFVSVISGLTAATPISLGVSLFHVNITFEETRVVY